MSSNSTTNVTSTTIKNAWLQNITNGQLEQLIKTFDTMVLNRLNIPVRAVYKGISATGRRNVEAVFRASDRQVLLYQYCMLRNDIDLHENCSDVMLLEPPINPRSALQAAMCVRRQTVRRPRLMDSFVEFLDKYQNHQI